MTLETFIRAHTVLARPALVPEFSLYLATEITPIWQATEEWLRAKNIAPPFWAFAWPGSQAIARYILDHPDLVAGKRVLDFAAGCGLAALAAARAGAASVEVAEIDPLSIAACHLNAEANGIALTGLEGDIVGKPCRWDMILTGDVFYEAPMSIRLTHWLRQCAEHASVWIADPGRAYLPQHGLRALASYDVPTSLELEDKLVRTTTVYEIMK